MSDFPPRHPHLPVLSSMSPESIGLDGLFASGASPASTAWPTANKAIYIPITLRANFYVRRVFWVNGGTANGNVDAGVYSLGGARLLSAGATAQGTINAVQSVALGTAVLLHPGSYYLALGLSSGTGTVFAWTSSARQLAAAGCAEQATAVALPDPATFATMAMTIAPIVGIADVTTI